VTSGGVQQQRAVTMVECGGSVQPWQRAVAVAQQSAKKYP